MPKYSYPLIRYSFDDGTQEKFAIHPCIPVRISNPRGPFGLRNFPFDVAGLRIVPSLGMADVIDGDFGMGRAKERQRQEGEHRDRGGLDHHVNEPTTPAPAT